jgi:hypothetical protein
MTTKSTTKKPTTAQIELLYLLAYPDAYILNDKWDQRVNRPGVISFGNAAHKPTLKAVIGSAWIEQSPDNEKMLILSAAGVSELVAADKIVSLDAFRANILASEAAAVTERARKLASTEIEVTVEDAYTAFYHRRHITSDLKSHRLTMGCLPNVSIEVNERSDWDSAGARVNISINERELRVEQMPHFTRLLARATEIATERERLVVWHDNDNDYDWHNDKNDYDTEAHKYDAKPIAIAPVEPTTLTLDDHQKYLVSLLANPNISEASTDDDGAYSISVKVNGTWEKKFWTNSAVQQLVDAGYLCKFPNRWNPKHDVVIIAKDRQTELFALAKKHAS